MSASLAIRNLTVHYDKIAAVRGVSFSVAAGTIAAVIGSNGAGKSTILNAISGLRDVREGEILFDGEDVTTMTPHLRTRAGIAQVPEGRRIFGRMTVAENIDIGGVWRVDSVQLAHDRERVLAMFPRLRERLSQHAGTLSGGEQQMLAVARALMSRPRLLLLDEPSMGLAPQVVDAVFDSILAVKREGLTVVLVEQNALRALEIADRGYVIQNGTLVLEGSGAELIRNDRVRAAYLGVESSVEA